MANPYLDRNFVLVWGLQCSINFRAVFGQTRTCHLVQTLFFKLVFHPELLSTHEFCVIKHCLGHWVDIFLLWIVVSKAKSHVITEEFRCHKRIQKFTVILFMIRETSSADNFIVIVFIVVWLFCIKLKWTGEFRDKSNTNSKWCPKFDLFVLGKFLKFCVAPFSKPPC